MTDSELSIRDVKPALIEFLKEFIDSREPPHRDMYIHRFRQFARYCRIQETDWPKAIERLFAMKPHQGRKTLSDYGLWLKRRRLNHEEEPLGGGGFCALTRYALGRGRLNWIYREPTLDHQRFPRSRKRTHFESLSTEWAKFRKACNFSPATIRSAESALSSLGAFLESKGLGCRDISGRILEDWGSRCLLRGIGPRSLRAMLTPVSKFCEWLVKTRRLQTNPALYVVMPHARRFPVPILEEREVCRLLTSSPKVRDRALLEFIYATGCRVGEVVRLDVDDISLQARRARCIGKGRRARMVLFNLHAARLLKAWLPVRAAILKSTGRESQKALFVNRFGERLRDWSIRVIVTKAGRSTLPGRRVYPHLLRHSFASHIMNRGADIVSVQKLLGHKYPATAAHYIRLKFSRIRQVYRLSHPRA